MAAFGLFVNCGPAFGDDVDFDDPGEEVPGTRLHEIKVQDRKNRNRINRFQVIWIVLFVLDRGPTPNIRMRGAMVAI
jgi:hypothetical protein